jgi:hypothetical protein
VMGWNGGKGVSFLRGRGSHRRSCEGDFATLGKGFGFDYYSIIWRIGRHDGRKEEDLLIDVRLGRTEGFKYMRSGLM